MNAAAVPETADDHVRPAVPLPSQGKLGLILFLVILVAGAAMLFGALSAGREERQMPRTTATLGGEGERISAPPPLALPPEYLDPAIAPPLPRTHRAPVLPPASPARARPSPERFAIPPGFMPPSAPPVVVESDIRPAPEYSSQFEEEDGEGSRRGRNSDRVTASRLANPSQTVPRGTVVPAVLETALDSTRPGAARALVQRDIRGFDGTRVLIPRGSRLYGEYQADVSPGQRRASIQWTRLLRPDGVTIALDSPASDPLGRAGLRGKVDSKFFQRFGGAILQSVLDIGVGVATREASEGVLVALPGSTQNVQITDQQQIQPTLKVRQGTSVSVFVARDLDFSTVDR